MSSRQLNSKRPYQAAKGCGTYLKIRLQDKTISIILLPDTKAYSFQTKNN